jgi:hypothetical protein
MTKLFLLNPDFQDSDSDHEGKRYYCPQCAMIEGLLRYYPQLEKMIEIQRVDFKKPRQSIVEIIGTENQSCPVLIIENMPNNNVDISYFTRYGGKFFVNSPDLIARYLSEKFGIGISH